MPKIITSRRREEAHEKAIEYVKSHILFPSGLLGLIFMVAEMAALAYQFMAMTYDAGTFAESLGLLVMGAFLGWAQTRYHQHILREDPGYFAARLRLHSKTGQKRRRKEYSAPLEHRGRQFVPLYYLSAVSVVLGASAWSAFVGRTYYVAAFLMPWAGFFWAKLFFWRGLLAEIKVPSKGWKLLVQSERWVESYLRL